MKFIGIDKKIDKFEMKFSGIDKKIDKLELQFKDRLSDLRSRVDYLTDQLAVQQKLAEKYEIIYLHEMNLWGVSSYTHDRDKLQEDGFKYIYHCKNGSEVWAKKIEEAKV